MVLRICVVQFQRKDILIESSLNRKEDRVILGFRTKNDKQSQYYEIEAFGHAIIITPQKYKKM